VEAGPVTDARGYGDDWRGNHSTHGAGERAFHAGANNYDPRSLQALVIADEAMDSGDADIVNGIDFVAHYLSRDAGFLGDRNVAGAGADHGYCSLAARFAIAPVANGAAEREIFASFVLIEERLRHFGRSPGNEHVFGAREEFPGDGEYVIRAFAEAEDDFRHAVAQGAVMIDLGETEILEGHVTQADESRLNVNRAGANIVEKYSELVFCHGTGLPLTA
jgi:hypothetical protein